MNQLPNDLIQYLFDYLARKQDASTSKVLGQLNRRFRAHYVVRGYKIFKTIQADHAEIGIYQLQSLTEAGMIFHHVRLDKHSDTEMVPCRLPSSIRHLELGKHWNEDLEPWLPPHLVSLTFSSPYACFDRPISKQCFSSTLKILHISYGYEHPLENLPDTLEELDLGELYCEKIEHWPKSLRRLKLSTYYYHPLNPVNNEFPELEDLHLGCHFNHPLDQISMPKLKDLHTGYRYNYPLPSLSSTLKKLTLGYHFSKPLTAFPPHLEFLKIKHDIYHFSLPKMPLTLKYLEIQTRYLAPMQELPDSLETLILYHCFYPIPFPKHLRKLDIHKWENANVSELPDSLEIWNIGSLQTDQKFHFPHQLKEWRQGLYFSHFFSPQELPLSLKYWKINTHHYATLFRRGELQIAKERGIQLDSW